MKIGEKSKALEDWDIGYLKSYIINVKDGTSTTHGSSGRIIDNKADDVHSLGMLRGHDLQFCQYLGQFLYMQGEDTSNLNHVMAKMMHDGRKVYNHLYMHGFFMRVSRRLLHT